MPLPLTVSCFSKIQFGFTFLVLADLDSPGKGPLNVCVCYSAPGAATSGVTCGPVSPGCKKYSPERPLPATGIPTRQAEGCLRVSLTASAWRRLPVDQTR